ncbi:LytTR family transcriptional regulator DNA-binding domain-containing protein [Lentibacillus jeotgali]|uniref:LytTR family transcriptional regulator DNA-binding domain-containing protein n=1 Tax=Lentibacillus jeotgali TaxID=558169 RepID=UPI0002625C1B|nr:LytTR family transcriptional regulator DNA-binding domain-containing protein [Lentibacillus jeotgali]
MGIFQLRQVEKNEGNTIIFPKIDLDVYKEEMIAIQCNNEVGKRLINMIIGRSPISSGEVFLEGLSLNHHFKSLSNRVGVFLLNEGMYERLTSEEYLKFLKKLYDVGVEINSLLRDVGLAEKRKAKISKLSYSEKKRLQLARVIIHQPDLLVMEEPDQNIDIESKIIMQRVLEEFKGHGKAILILTNNFESAISMTNMVYRLNEEGLKKIDVVDEGESSEAEEENMPKEQMKEESTTHIPIQFEKIPAKVDDKIILFDPTEITYVESNEGVSHLHVNGETFPCSITLNNLFERLQPFGFFRCHRSYIVNLQKVREVITWTRNSYSLVLEDSKKSSIPLSKGNLSELKSVLKI